ncbi:hypothetical protein L6164_023585 [Bauhinia variegata]|uniref:Uncharacterized protein n=1 Tax=Bauhinia variegata TaxID=167791 RepID=A0ACB9MK86_BAUVA|nr:hypothetical protein L6164_023585 [Bauhinia variegata]
MALVNTASSIPFAANTFPNRSIKLDRDNYFLCRTTALSFLEAFDMEGFVTDLTLAPSLVDIDDYTIWKRKDPMILLWLKTHIGDKMLHNVARSTTSRDAWVTLETIFYS